MLPAILKATAMQYRELGPRVAQNEGFDMKAVGIPTHLAAAGSLVGAAMDDLKHEDLMNQHVDPREYQDKWIYPD